MVNGKFSNQDLDKIVIQKAKIRQRFRLLKKQN